MHVFAPTTRHGSANAAADAFLQGATSRPYARRSGSTNSFLQTLRCICLWKHCNDRLQLSFPLTQSLFRQDTSSVLIRHCGTLLFTLPLPGATLLTLDFIRAANSIASNTDLRDVSHNKCPTDTHWMGFNCEVMRSNDSSAVVFQAPRADAICLLGALLCFPNHFATLPVLQSSEVDLKVTACPDIKVSFLQAVQHCFHSQLVP